MTTLPSPRHHAQIIRLNESSLKEYIKLHESVWPEVLAAIHRANIRNYSIFLDEQNYTLFATFEYVGNDFEKDMEGVKDDEKTREWWELTDGMQVLFSLSLFFPIFFGIYIYIYSYPPFTCYLFSSAPLLRDSPVLNDKRYI